jgi:hypothetical protein
MQDPSGSIAHSGTTSATTGYIDGGIALTPHVQAGQARSHDHRMAKHDIGNCTV